MSVSSPKRAQLELPISRERTPDRNFDKGGRSFYFFDLDDNVLHVDTRIFLFHRDTGEELAVSTRRFAEISHAIGKPGELERFRIVDDDAVGSFRRFRDLPDDALGGREQPFIEDLAQTLHKPDVVWKGPSWPFFYHAVYNARPVAIITARGHEPQTLARGLERLHGTGYLHAPPSYLGVYTVTNPGVRAALGDPARDKGVPELKRAAIFAAVEAAFRLYGDNPHHRFGVSDDDANNLARIIGALEELKDRHKDNAFFVIDASKRPVVKTEILRGGSTRSFEVAAAEQLALFG